MNNFTISPLDPAIGRTYDLIFCASGSEQRCTHWYKVCKPKSVKKIDWVYSRNDDERSLANVAYFERHGFRPVCEGVLTVKQAIRGILETIAITSSAKIAIDVSSMTRELMATWVSELSTHQSKHDIEVEFCYSRAKFSPPARDSGLADRPVPVIPEFAGLWNAYEKPLLLIIGVGYEPYLGMSFCEFLDPSNVVAFVPDRHEIRYNTEIERQNKELFEFISDRNELLLKYDIGRPFDLYTKLESVVFGRIGTNRINIAPYGLKTFALCSFLVAARHAPKVLVWHLNPSRPAKNAPNRIASGEVTGLKVIFRGRSKGSG